MHRLVSGALAILLIAVGLSGGVLAADGASFSQKDIPAPMRDGVRLLGDLYHPEGQGPWPCILQRTPYLKDRDRFPVDAVRYTRAGYAYFVQDVRGRGRSEGAYLPFMAEIADGYDSVEWVAAQPWCNGRVGMTGASAHGMASLMAAIANPPHLVAAYVVVAPASRTTFPFVGGAFKGRDLSDWGRRQGLSDAEISRQASLYPDSALWRISEIADNRPYIDIPIYHVGGWFDIFSGGTVDNFVYLQNDGARGARGRQKLAMGPTGHGPISGDLEFPDSTRSDDEIRWFDHWLKGVDTGIMDEPPVHAYVMGDARKGKPSARNGWMALANWPPAYRETRYYLGREGRLSTQPPTASSASLRYRADPRRPVPTVGGPNLVGERGPMDQRAIPQRADYLRFMTEPLQREVTIMGPVFAELWAATDGPDTDFMVKLIDVYPDGYEAIMLEAALRTRYRHGRRPDDIAMMTPGAPEKLILDLWPTALTFEKGHRIGVHISSSNAPRFDVNPNTGGTLGPGAPMRIATNTLYMDAERPSALVLPLVYLDP